MPPAAPNLLVAMPSPGMTIAQARRALAGAFRAGRTRYARARCAPLDRPCARLSTMPASPPQSDPQLDADADARIGRAGGAAARARAGRAHPRHEGILGPGAADHATRRWCRGRRPKPWSKRRWPRSTAADRARRAMCIADLGTGSGALLLALLSELPNARGVGTDVSAEALAVARDNARRLGLAARAQFIAAISARRWPADSISWSAIRPISPAATSQRWRPRCDAIRAARSTAAPTAWPAIAPSPARRADCSSQPAIWWSNSASARSGPWQRCSARPVLRPRPRAPISAASRVRCMHVLPQWRHDP